MRRFLLASTAALTLVSSAAYAEGVAKPKMAPDTIMVSTQNSASSLGLNGELLLMVLVLGLLIASAHGGGGTVYVPPS